MSALPDSATSPHVVDVTEQNFEAEVISRSATTPVLVDLWAEWCGPCKSLGPVLEKLAAAYNGAFVLAKIDVDREQMLAASFGVRSIPMVILIQNGQPVDGFNGALPEGALREFLTRNGIEPAADAEEGEAPPETAAQAIARIQQEIAAEPERAELKLDLALAQMRAGNVEAAANELDNLPANLATDPRARRLEGQLELARALADAPARAELEARLVADENDLEARDLLGVRLVLEGEPAAGLEQFLAVLRADRNWNEGLARRRLIAAFDLIEDEDLVATFRRRMSSLLF